MDRLRLLHGDEVRAAQHDVRRVRDPHRRGAHVVRGREQVVLAGHEGGGHRNRAQ